MITQTGNSKVDNQNQGWMNRRRNWNAVIFELQQIVKNSDQYAIGAAPEIEKLNEVKELMKQIKASK
jgi:hypothetical protein